jgi:hypothetical protein
MLDAKRTLTIGADGMSFNCGSSPCYGSLIATGVA